MKKHARTLVTQETGAEIVELKVWNKQNLRREDWDFSGLIDFPQEMLRVGWLYEVDRELGSDNPPYFTAWELHELKKRKVKLRADLDGTHRLSVSELKALLPEIPPDKGEVEAEADLKRMLEEKPDMTLAEEEDVYRQKDRALDKLKSRNLERRLKAEAKGTVTNWKPPSPKEPEPILKSYPYEGLIEKIPAWYRWASGEGYHTTIHPLEIDWTLTETELLEAFRNWLRKGDHAPLHTSYKRVAGRSKVGKRKTEGWLAWLRELAIYRISEAGYTHSEGLQMMGMKSVGSEQKPAISASNWEHAQARTLERIEKNLIRCAFSAWSQGAGSPENWRDCFVKPFGL